MLQSCSSSPPHTSLSQSQNFSKDSCLKQGRRQEVRLRFIDSTCFRRGKLFISSMYVHFYFVSTCLWNTDHSRHFSEIPYWSVVCHFIDITCRYWILYSGLDLEGIRYIRSWLDCVRSLCTYSKQYPHSGANLKHPSTSFLFSLLLLVRSHPSSLIPKTIKDLTYPKACGLKTIVANGIYASSSVFDPSILSWITSFFVLTIVTQISATTLIAGRIYAASQPFQISGEVEDGMSDDVVGEKKVKGGRKYESTQREKYLATVWLVVESGLIYTSAAIVQLVTYLLKMNAGVIMEFMLSQLSVSVFFFSFPIYILSSSSSSLSFPVGNSSDGYRNPYWTGPRISRRFQHTLPPTTWLPWPILIRTFLRQSSKQRRFINIQSCIPPRRREFSEYKFGGFIE